MADAEVKPFALSSSGGRTKLVVTEQWLQHLPDLRRDAHIKTAGSASGSAAGTAPKSGASPPGFPSPLLTWLYGAQPQPSFITRLPGKLPATQFAFAAQGLDSLDHFTGSAQLPASWSFDAVSAQHLHSLTQLTVSPHCLNLLFEMHSLLLWTWKPPRQ